MERLAGRVFSSYALPASNPAERRAVYFAMADTMAKLHRVDVNAVGLADFGRPAITSYARSRAGPDSGKAAARGTIAGSIG
jgi:aminoglycoside phosphotransferase (APT) family kinase protein